MRQIQRLRRERGLTWGMNQVYRWVNDEIEAGRVTRIEGYYKQADKRTVRKVYYVTK